MKTLGRLLLVASLVTGLFGLVSSAWPSYAEDSDSGTMPLLVEVRESEPRTPSPTPTGTQKPSPEPKDEKDDKSAGKRGWVLIPGDDLKNQPTSKSGSGTAAKPVPTSSGGGGGGSSGVGQETVPDDTSKDRPPQETCAGLCSDEVTSDGIVYVGALRSQYHWSINPLGGSLVLSVPIRNASPEPVTAIAIFTVRQFFGGRVGLADVEFVINLKPGESTIVTGRVGSMAQWTLVKSQVTVSRLGSDDAWGLGSVTRDRWVFFFPWFIALMVALLIAGAIWWRRHRNDTVQAHQPDGSDEAGCDWDEAVESDLGGGHWLDLDQGEVSLGQGSGATTEAGLPWQP